MRRPVAFSLAFLFFSNLLFSPAASRAEDNGIELVAAIDLSATPDALKLGSLLGTLAQGKLRQIEAQDLASVLAGEAADGSLEKAKNQLFAAKRAYAALKYDEASALLEEASALVRPTLPAAGARNLLFEISLTAAMTYTAGGDRERSLRAYQLAAALDSTTDPDRTAYSPKVRKALQRVRKRASKENGQITVMSTPPGAEILLDGQSRGKTPLTVDGLGMGAHNLLLRMPRHAPVAKEVLVAKTQITTVAFSLEPREGAALVGELRSECKAASEDERGPCLAEVAKLVGARWLAVRSESDDQERYSLFGTTESRILASVDTDQPSEAGRTLFKSVPGQVDVVVPPPVDDRLPRALVWTGALTAGGLWFTTILVAIIRGAEAGEVLRFAIPVIGPAIGVFERERGGGEKLLLGGDTILQVVGIGTAIVGWMIWPEAPAAVSVTIPAGSPEGGVLVRVSLSLD